MGNKLCKGEVSSIPPNGDVKQMDRLGKSKVPRKVSPGNTNMGFISTQTELSHHTEGAFPGRE